LALERSVPGAAQIGALVFLFRAIRKFCSMRILRRAERAILEQTPSGAADANPWSAGTTPSAGL